MKNIKSYLAMACAGGALTAFAQDAKAGCSADVYRATVCFMAADYCPRGYFRANGQTLPIIADGSLYTVISDTFGGNGRNSYQLPDLQGRSVIGTGMAPRTQTMTTRGQKVGGPTVQLSTDNMASHNHAIDLRTVTLEAALRVSSNTGTRNEPAGNYLAASKKVQSPQYATSLPSPPVPVLQMAGAVTGNLSKKGLTATEPSGKGMPVDVQGPRATLTVCIADGTKPFPPRQ